MKEINIGMLVNTHGLDVYKRQCFPFAAACKQGCFTICELLKQLYRSLHEHDCIQAVG